MNIQLYGQHMEEDDRAYALGNSISEFVERFCEGDCWSGELAL